MFLENPKPMVLFSRENKEVRCVNSSFEERYCDSSLIVGKRLTEISRPVSTDFYQKGSDGKTQKEHLELTLSSGKSKLITLLYKEIPDNSGLCFAVVEPMNPISGSDLRVEDPLFKSIFDKALDIILVANDEGRFVEVNNTACQKLGYSRDELLNMGVVDITFGPMKSYGDKKWDDFIRTGSDEGEYLLQTKDGEVLYTEYRAIANIRPGRHLSILRDVSDKKKMEDALEASKNRFYRLLEAAPDAILVVDKKGDILYTNTRAEQLMGYEEDELTGQPIEILVPDSISKKHRKYHQEFNRDPEKRPMGSGLDLTAVRKDGTHIPVDIMLGPLKEDGNLQTLAIVRDVTDFRKAQKKLKKEKEFTTLLHKLTKIANEEDSLESALEQSIEEICRFMKWSVGHAYLPAEDGSGKFIPTDIWYLEEDDKFRDFVELTMDTSFQEGEGMIGKIMKTGKPDWRRNVKKDSDFVRKISDKELEVRSCFGFPIIVKDDVVGILEFFTTDTINEDALILEKMSAIGHQLGRVKERLEAEHKLKWSEQKFKKLFDTAHDAILIMDRNGVAECNKSAEKLFQSSCHQIKKHSFEAFFPQHQPDGHQSENLCNRKLEKALRGEDQFFEWRFRRSDGSIVDTEVSLIYAPLFNEDMVQAVIHDITGRKEKDRLIRKNMQLFSQLFENSPIGLLMLDEKQRVKNINKSFRNIFGYRIDDIQGQNIDNFFAPDDVGEEAAELSERTLHGEKLQVESVRCHKDGSRVPVLIATVPVEIENEIVAIFGMYVDISKRKKTEEKLEKQLQEKQVLLAEIHHRVKNNMAVISGLLELQKDTTQNQDAYEKMKDSQARIQSMALIHEQLYQKELFASVRFDEYVKNLGSTIAASFCSIDTDIEVVYDTELVELNMDQAIPCGLLLNELITNAFKHAFPGHDKGKITIKVGEESGKAFMEVSDNGIGISSDFDNMKGESLGMRLVQTLTQQLAGNLEIDNDNGSTFHLSFEINES